MEGESKVEHLISNLKEYVETQYDLVVLNIQDKVSDILSSIAWVTMVAVLAAMETKSL